MIIDDSMSKGTLGQLRANDVPGVILAGGKGLRLRPYTLAKPKALLPVDGEPILGRQLAIMAKAGIRRVVVVTGHLSEAIEDYLRLNSFDVAIETVCQRSTNGSASAFALGFEATRQFSSPDTPVFVTACDYVSTATDIVAMIDLFGRNSVEAVIAKRKLEGALGSHRTGMIAWPDGELFELAKFAGPADSTESVALVGVAGPGLGLASAEALVSECEVGLEEIVNGFLLEERKILISDRSPDIDLDNIYLAPCAPKVTCPQLTG